MGEISVNKGKQTKDRVGNKKTGYLQERPENIYQKEKKKVKTEP